MDKEPNKVSNEADKPVPAPAEKPETLADEQLDDAAGGLLTWDGGGSGGPRGGR